MKNIDKEILNLLQKNSRYSNTEIADLINCSLDDVESSIKELIENGVIRQFSTVVNSNLIDGYPVQALVELSIRPQKDTGFDAIAKRIYKYSEVISHYLVSGQYDFLLVVEGKDHKDIAHFVFDKLATIENVTSTTTHFIFKSYKENGVILEEEKSSSRLAIMP